MAERCTTSIAPILSDAAGTPATAATRNLAKTSDVECAYRVVDEIRRSLGISRRGIWFVFEALPRS